MFNWIFGANKYQLQDTELGAFNSFKIEGKKVHWVGNIPLFGTVPLEIIGDRYQINTHAKNKVLNWLSQEKILEPTIDFVLEEAYCVDHPSYENWRTHFYFSNIQVDDDQLVLTFQELGNLKTYHLYFEDLKFLKIELI